MTEPSAEIDLASGVITEARNIMQKNFPQKKTECDPREIALKSFFLGPQAENSTWVMSLLSNILNRWVHWRRSLYPNDGRAISLRDQKSYEFLARSEGFERVANELVTRFEKEVPKFSPRYVGHMFSEISLPALIGHIVTLLHNPNNISGESSRVGIQIEDEAVRFLNSMVGFPVQTAVGHFTSGGTLANFEALSRANARYALWMSAEILRCTHKASKLSIFKSAHMGWGKFDELISQLKGEGLNISELSKFNILHSNPFTVSKKIEEISNKEFLGPVILVPENKHYSWQKGCKLMGIGADSLWPIELDKKGSLSVDHLKSSLEKASRHERPILLVVSVLGTTELGGIDPVHKVQDLLDDYCKLKNLHIWHHVDGAYGGFFRTLDLKKSKVLSEESIRSLSATPRVSSITLDPHKLGYVPYASGAILVRDKRDYYFETHGDAPYIDFNKSVDRGPYTLEGSRSAAGAVATWMTSKTMGFQPGGYGLLLERTTRIRNDLAKKILDAKLDVHLAPGCDTNILCFSCGKNGDKISSANKKTLRVYEAFSTKNSGSFMVSKTSLMWKSYKAYLDEWTRSWSAHKDEESLVLIRMCMMNPFFGSKETEVDYSKLFVEKLELELNKINY